MNTQQLIALLCCLLLSIPGQAATCTLLNAGVATANTPTPILLSQTGATEWSCGAKPGPSDDVIGLDGKTLVIDEPWEINTFTAKATTAGTIILNIEAPLLLHGDLTQGNNVWTVDSRGSKTGKITFHNDTTAPNFYTGDTTVSAAVLNLLGDVAEPARITSTGTQKINSITNKAGGAASARLNFDHAEITNCGSTGTYCVSTKLGRPGATQTVWNTRIDGGLTFGQIAQTEALSVNNLTITGTYRTDRGALWLDPQPVVSTASRVLNNVVVNGALRVQWASANPLATGTNITGDNWYVSGGFLGGNTLRPDINVTNMMVVTTANTMAGSQFPSGNFSRFISLAYFPAAGGTINSDHFRIGNPHIVTINGGIWQAWTNGTFAGDPYVVDSTGCTGTCPTTYPRTTSMSDILLLPATGTFAGDKGGYKSLIASVDPDQTNSTFSIENVTMLSARRGDRANFTSFHTPAATFKAGMFQYVRNNYIAAAPGNEAYELTHAVDLTPIDGQWNQVDYNAKINFNTDGYPHTDSKYTNPSPPGANDLVDVPARFSSTPRDFLTWCQSIDGAISDWPTCLDRIAKMNDTDFDPRYRISTAYDWIRAAYVPANPRYWGTGFNGKYIGAVKPSNLQNSVLAAAAVQ